MKILYIGHINQDSGWGRAGRDYLLAMDSVGLDVVARPVFVGGSKIKDPRISKLENKSSRNCDVCIQHLLPHYMMYDSNFKNIGLYVMESHNAKLTPWSTHLNLMDEVWVPCNDMYNYGISNGIQTKMQVVPHAFDLKKYEQEYPPLDIPDLDGNYTFYYIGEFNKRKNLEALLIAFHTEFSQYEPVSLVLKLNMPGKSENELAKLADELNNNVKDSLRLYINRELYRPIITITQRLPELELMRLHRTCDCFVSTSHAEAWCIPAFEASTLGNSVIASAYGGPVEYVHPDMLTYVQESVCTDMHSTFPGHSTARERWVDVNIPMLMRQMRYCYENGNKYRDWQKQKCQEFSYESIGNKIKEFLNESS